MEGFREASTSRRDTAASYRRVKRSVKATRNGVAWSEARSNP
jgi:hypothetical protein